MAPVNRIEYHFISYTILRTCIQFNIRLWKKKIKKTKKGKKRDKQKVKWLACLCFMDR